MKTLFIGILITLSLISCSEEVLTNAPQFSQTNIAGQQVSNLQACSAMQLDKPPVDILYVVDNSGSSLLSSFQSIKSQIANTITTINSQFDYHIYVAPLNPPSGSSATSYPLIVSDTGSLSSTVGLNIKSIDDLTSDFFSGATGNNSENGFQRAHDLIQNNRSNGIFRNNANTIIVMVSNGDDTSSTVTIGGNKVNDPAVYNNHLTNFKKLTKKYSMTNSVSNPMNAESLRFVSLVAHSNCNGQIRGSNYISMSEDIYDYMGYTDDSMKDTRNLCSGNFSNIFSAVNSSVAAVVTGHKYDHWLISTASASSIQANDITLTKVMANGSTVNIPESSSNGFQYLGNQSAINTRYYPTAGAPVSGLVVKLNGTARVEYPDCIIAKTKSPLEHYKYIVIPRKPVVSSIIVKVNGITIAQSSTDGWVMANAYDGCTSDGFCDSINVKVAHQGTSSTPEVYKSGYFLRLSSSKYLTNGDTVQVFYSPDSI
ncbi:MAG: hypothetical protein N4A33_02440 [Bacteriovoracaceae bacterium]|nr:hypothetical protein [Bacteriovoracaceae bacterium]